MFQTISASKFYWLFLLLFAISLEATALVYQYFLDYYPCVICIHIRIIVLGMILISLAGLKFYAHHTARIILHLTMTGLFIIFIERSYHLLGVERGFVFGDCSMNSGLPDWFAIDQWFPSVFKIWEPCGYTPELLFGITMAEALIVISVALSLFSIILFFYSIKSFRK